MLGAVAVHVGLRSEPSAGSAPVRAALRTSRPSQLDARLWIGAALFGVGWGLSAFARPTWCRWPMQNTRSCVLRRDGRRQLAVDGLTRAVRAGGRWARAYEIRCRSSARASLC